jgi:hypothetical protein
MPPERSIQINHFTGADLNPDTTQIDISKSPDMLNITLDNDGTPDKRTGYSLALELGEGAVNGIVEYGELLLIAHGTKLYKWDKTNAPVLLGTIADDPLAGFVFDGVCYMVNGSEYLSYDGTSFGPVIPYVPTLTVSTPPAGGGTTLDQFNLLGAGFKQSYDGDNTATVYQLALKGLDATAVTLTIAGVAKTEGTHFTVDRTNGTINFAAGTTPHGAPATGVNNVVITAYKTVSGHSDRVKKCTGWNIFGGSNDTRIHLFGNPDHQTKVFRSGVLDPSYFPENDFQDVGTGKVTGKVNQYDTSVILKENGIWSEAFELSDPVSFPTKPVNSKIGCIAPGSVQLVENNPVFLAPDGVYMLTSSQVRDERNVKLLSERINSDLLKRDLKNALSVEYGSHYMLCFPDGYVWVWNYRLDAWYLWNNVHATCFCVSGDRLYFGTADGNLMMFKKPTDASAYSDNGEAIAAHWTTKMLGFDAEAYEKAIRMLHVNLRPDLSVAMKVEHRSERSTWETVAEVSASIFSYDTFNYDTFTYKTTVLPLSFAKKVKKKGIVYYQLRFSDDNINTSMGLLFMAIHYHVTREVR